MSGMEAAILPAIINAGANVAPMLMAGRGADPTGAVTSQPPQPQARGGAGVPQGMQAGTAANVGGQDQAMQILLMLMQALQQNPGLISTQNPMSPVGQQLPPGMNPTAVMPGGISGMGV